jgi:hypothetical protein
MPRVPADTKRPVSEDSLSIDVRRWSGDGLLRPYQEFSCTWCQGDEALASIRVGIEADATFLAKAGAAVLTFQWRVGRPPSGPRSASTCPSRGPSAISAAPDHGFYVRRMPEMGGAAAAASQSYTSATVISSSAVGAFAWPVRRKVRAHTIEAFGAFGKFECGSVAGRASSTPSRASRQGCIGGPTVAGLTGQNKNRSVG